MVSVFDVAKYILTKSGPMSCMKLQKLIYYCQAWSLVWDDKALFPEEIQAWANGPVVPELWKLHKGQFQIDAGNFSGLTVKLDADQMETIDSVVEFYGRYNTQALSDLTHSETPWKKAREGMADGERGNNEISLSDMADYYGSL